MVILQNKTGINENNSQSNHTSKAVCNISDGKGV